MQVLVNGLSANHPSGKHVLYGHLAQLAKWTAGTHSFLVLVPSDCDCDVDVDALGDNVSSLSAPEATSRPWRRWLWERIEIPKIIRNRNIRLYFTPAGTTLGNCPAPQVSLAQNPWCMTKAVRKSIAQRIRAAVQRKAYARAQASADLMTYNSGFMRELYRENANVEPRRSAVVYQAIDESTHRLAQQLGDQVPRSDNTILAVSVMASWKGADQLVRALAQLRGRGIDAQLRLVGPWPDAGYQQQVRELLRQSGLEEFVTITGKVSRQQLYREMAAARIFALPSRCESFGIPAVEAQAFGTPVIGSSTTAMAEIGGGGGEYCDPSDLATLTDLLARQLTDSEHWQTLSDAARENAAKFRWEECSRPLLQMFDLV